MGYVDEVLQRVKSQNGEQKEFNQAVQEVLESLRPVIEQDEAKYRKQAILERQIVNCYLEFLGSMIKDKHKSTMLIGFNLTMLLGHIRVAYVCTHQLI